MDRQHWQKHAQMNREEGGISGVGKVSGRRGYWGRRKGGRGHLHPVTPTPREEPRQHRVAHWPSPRGEPC